MRFSEKHPRSRMRVTTPSTTGSFISIDTHRTISIYKDDLSGLTESEFILEVPAQSDLFTKTLELYFKVDEKTIKVNEMCTELLRKENSIQYLKKCIEEKESNSIADDASKSVELLKDEQKLSQNELGLISFEKSVKKLEKETENGKDLLTKLENFLIVSKKNLQEKEKLLKILTKTESKKEKLTRKIALFRSKKAELMKNLLESKQKAEVFAIIEEVSEKKNESSNLETSIEALKQKTSTKKQEQLAYYEELLSSVNSNNQLKKEVQSLSDLVLEKNHQILSRKQWLEEYSRKINSKFALNRVSSKKIEQKQRGCERKGKIIEDCFFEVDKMEAKQEAEELKLKKNETSFKEELRTIIQKTKRGAKIVSFK